MNYYNSFHVIGENSEKRTVSKGYDTFEEAKFRSSLNSSKEYRDN